MCDQHHDVHVAYQTSGNIAVGDEEVVRYCEYLRDVCSKYSPSDTTIKDKADEIIRYLRYEKVENDAAERPDVLFMKGTIRREEARHACRYTGIKDDSHIHFLDLPFYETGLVKKNPISEADKDIIKNLLEELKPDQIFVAGDLADPHGTHKVCLDAILAAVDEIKDEDWLKLAVSGCTVELGLNGKWTHRNGRSYFSGRVASQTECDPETSVAG